MIDKNANINVKSAQNDTPLIIATYYRHLKIVKMLIDHKANLFTKGDQNKNALEWAEYRNWGINNQNIINLLKENMKKNNNN